jgi:hypothetical protein
VTQPKLASFNATFTSTPHSRNGLRGRTAKDMREREWGELAAIRQGWGGRWFFACKAKRHEVLLSGSKVRAAGDEQTCPECEKERAR